MTPSSYELRQSACCVVRQNVQYRMKCSRANKGSGLVVAAGRDPFNLQAR